MKRAIAVLVGMFAVLLLGAVPASAHSVEATATGAEDDFVVLNGGLRLAEGQALESATVINGPIEIAGNVRGDVFAANGDVTVTGRVDGDVVAVNGAVNVMAGGAVAGDVSSRDAATVAPGGTIAGSQETINLSAVGDIAGIIGAALVWVAVSASTLALGFLLLWIAPRMMDSAMTAMRTATGASIGWGFAVAIGVPLLALLALATIVGAPLGLGVLMAMSFLYSVGYVVAAFMLGRRILPETNRSRALSFLAGWAIFRVLAIVPVVGSLMWIAAPIVGLGALTVAAWRVRRGATTSMSEATRTVPSSGMGAAPA